MLLFLLVAYQILFARVHLTASDALESGCFMPSDVTSQMAARLERTTTYVALHATALLVIATYMLAEARLMQKRFRTQLAFILFGSEVNALLMLSQSTASEKYLFADLALVNSYRP